jgi:predicted HicB family RNase H-like nuclease
MADSKKFNLIMPNWLREQLEIVAKAKGIGMSEYIKDELKIALRRDIEAIKLVDQKTEAAD